MPPGRALPLLRRNRHSSWSEHAYGEAVDLNTIENPYVGCGRTRERSSLPYLNRSRLRPGMVTPAVVAAFRSIGWGWGGNWTGSTKDYMHCSATSISTAPHDGRSWYRSAVAHKAAVNKLEAALLVRPTAPG